MAIGFREFLTEKSDVVALKSKIKTMLEPKIKITQSSRGDYHIRFPFEGDPRPFFNRLGLDVVDHDVAISSKFETKAIVTTRRLGNIPAGTSIPWVNNYIGQAKTGAQLFNNKDLSPDNLGLAGMTVNYSQIVEKVTLALESKYDKEVSSELISLLKQSNKKSEKIKLNTSLSFSTKDLAKVSADFGEIMSAVWAMKNLGFNEVFFPIASNEKLIDFYAIRMGIRYPISVKSGGGGKVTIQNILSAIKSRAKTAGMENTDESSLAVFNIVKEYPMREQMIELHKYMKTKAINRLAEIMNVDYKSINLETVKNYVSSKTNEELIKELTPFWNVLKMNLTDKVKFGNDKIRLVISPLGESIWKILNASEDIKKSLTNVARQVSLIQVNVDAKKSSVNFQHNFFKEAEFEFGWAGYAAGNKLGFKMRLVK